MNLKSSFLNRLAGSICNRNLADRVNEGVFRDLLSNEATYDDLGEQLMEILNLARNAEQRMRRS